MIVLSHRGHWHTHTEKNTKAAFRRSFDQQFGTETDIRDLAGELVISHDMPLGGELTINDFLALTAGRQLPLAINIKADGLASKLAQAMESYSPKHWFVFDMSIPDLKAHLQAGNPVFTRMSELEREPVALNEAVGVWLDSFDRDWFGAETITDLLHRGKRVCVVSPELHGRHA